MNSARNDAGVLSKMTAAGDKTAIVDEAGKRIRDSKTRSQMEVLMCVCEGDCIDSGSEIRRGDPDALREMKI